VSELYRDVVGQDRAVGQLRASALAPIHAYLLVGPAGSGSLELARSFAASLVCPHGGCGSCPHCVRALAGLHPDVTVRERAGPYITVDDAREIGRLASLSPLEGRRKVLVLTDFHLVREAAPALLKVIEEPPPTTVFVVLAEQVPPELVTIASRCVRVELAPLSLPQVTGVLVSEGVDPAAAVDVAAAAGGRLDRARLLASDPGFGARQGAWREVPARLDGTGATVAVVAEELLTSVDTVLEPLRQRQANEVEELLERARLYGERGGIPREVESRHRREQRRVRLDELRSGLTTLAAAYRERLAGGASPRACVEALDTITGAAEALTRNPNEVLLLQALLVRLSGLRAGLAYSAASPE
jgi:DNA polymerase-3 subunit delta'